MSYKVIVADDSQTIQKVINITLAKQPYNLVECLSEDSLFRELERNKAELVCLDFNLSEKFSGPELAEKIKAISPSTQILFLLGTFDTVDDATMEKCGVADKIVKPFDSNKFISLCKRLTHQEPGISNPPQETSSFDEIESQWTVSDSVEKLPPRMSDENPLFSNEINALDKEMSDWGMSVPGIIDRDSTDTMIDLPPVIDSFMTEAKLPATSDLDYPSVKANPATPSANDLEYPDTKPKKDSGLISIDTMDSYSSNFELEGNYVPDESDANQIKELIKDEVEDDLWKADEFEEFRDEVSETIGELARSTNDLFKTEDDLFPRLDAKDTIQEISFGAIEKISNSNISSKEEIELLVEKYVKLHLEGMFAKQIEKIAWEMIPDLAENLIRSELKKISNKVLEDQD